MASVHIHLLQAIFNDQNWMRLDAFSFAEYLMKNQNLPYGIGMCYSS